MTGPFRVVCAIDSQMTYALTVLLGSLSRTATRSFRVTVGYLDNSLPAGHQKVIHDVAKALGVDLDFLPLPSNPLFITQGHISPTTFAKFLLADAISEPHLWLDADTIVLPGWEGIIDIITSASTEKGLVVAGRHAPQASSTDLAFNAGVLGWPSGTRRDWSTPLAGMDSVDTQEQALFNRLYASTAITVSEKYNALTYHHDVLDENDMPFIIHYAGAHKPWHLHRRHAHLCKAAQCPWAAWFDAEEKLLTEASGSATHSAVTALKARALRSGRLHTGRDHNGLRLLRILTLLGPVAPALVWALRRSGRNFPRGTHPLH